jgi:hypothetical protein
LFGYDQIGIKAGGGSVTYGSGAIGGSIHLNNILDFNKGFMDLYFQKQLLLILIIILLKVLTAMKNSALRLQEIMLSVKMIMRLVNCKIISTERRYYNTNLILLLLINCTSSSDFMDFRIF